MRFAVSRPRRPFRTLADVRQFRGFGAADQGMSFTQPGVICDLSVITKLPEAQARRAYCDCAFLEQHATTELTINGNVWPQMPQLSDAEYDAMLKPIIARVAAGGEPYSLKVKVWTSRGAPNSNWHKCMTGFCASPDGCYNPDSDQRDALNVHPLMLYPPWDDVGAAARGIPLRGANMWYTFGQLVTYDAGAYDPLDLWKILWTNPGLFGLLGLKASLIPFNPQALYFLSGGVGVFPAVVEEILRRYGPNADWGKLLLDPVGKGWVQFGKLLLTYLPKCGFGIPGACGVGILLQQGASDQIASGEIDKVLDPTSKAIIIFLSKYGAAVVDRLFSLAQMAASARADPTLISLFGDAFLTCSTFPGIDSGVKLAFVLGNKLFKMAYAIVQGVRDGKSPLAVGDAAVYALLGFSPALVISQTQKIGAAAGQGIIDAATAETGLNLNQMAALAAQLIPMVQQIIAAITEINNKIQGGLEDVILLFKSVENAVNASAHLSVDAIRAAQNTVQAAGSTIVTASGGTLISSGRTKAPIVNMTPQTVVGGAGAARAALVAAAAAKTEDATPQAGPSASIGQALIAASIGFAVGGPAGSVVGFLAAQAMKPKALGGFFGAAPSQASQQQQAARIIENREQIAMQRQIGPTSGSCIGVACPGGQYCLGGRCVSGGGTTTRAARVPSYAPYAPQIPGAPSNATPAPSDPYQNPGKRPTTPQRPPTPKPVPGNTYVRPGQTVQQAAAQAAGEQRLILDMSTGQQRTNYPQQIAPSTTAAEQAAAQAQAAAAAAQQAADDVVGVARQAPGATGLITGLALAGLAYFALRSSPRKALSYSPRRKRRSTR